MDYTKRSFVMQTDDLDAVDVSFLVVMPPSSMRRADPPELPEVMNVCIEKNGIDLTHLISSALYEAIVNECYNRVED